MMLSKEYVESTIRRFKTYELILSSSEINDELKTQLPDWWLEWIDSQSPAESLEKFKQQFAPFQEKLPELLEEDFVDACSSVIIANDGLGRYLCFQFLGKAPNIQAEPFIWQKDYIYEDIFFWDKLDEWISDMFEYSK